MKKAGIIGGIGPASTLDYYSGIIKGVRSCQRLRITEACHQQRVKHDGDDRLCCV